MLWNEYLAQRRAPGERVRAWLLDLLPCAPDWMTARDVEAARAAAKVGRRALRTARERLLAVRAIEKGRDGFQGPWRYRRAAGLGANDVEDDVGEGAMRDSDCSRCRGTGRRPDGLPACPACEGTGCAPAVLDNPTARSRAFTEAHQDGDSARTEAIAEAIVRRVT